MNSAAIKKNPRLDALEEALGDLDAAGTPTAELDKLISGLGSAKELKEVHLRWLGKAPAGATKAVLVERLRNDLRLGTIPEEDRCADCGGKGCGSCGGTGLENEAAKHGCRRGKAPAAQGSLFANVPDAVALHIVAGKKKDAEAPSKEELAAAKAAARAAERAARAVAKANKPKDARLPACGVEFSCTYKGETFFVTATETNFVMGRTDAEGRVCQKEGVENVGYKSISAAGAAITGSHCNGVALFRLGMWSPKEKTAGKRVRAMDLVRELAKDPDNVAELVGRALALVAEIDG
uniref:Uncharacterized protein n=1 Tax=viral metagenome TaxID=1070528 RepID=A0A6H1ZA06_9ZZZZ